MQRWVAMVAALVAAAGCAGTISGRGKDADVLIGATGGVCWSANVGGATQDGCGSKTFHVHDDLGLFSSNVQKRSDGPDLVSITITQDGNTLATNSTSAAYGVAQVIASP